MRQPITWQDFIGGLSRCDWSRANDRDEAVVALLRQVAEAPQVIAERTREILASEELFAALRPYHNYPMILMDKIVLHLDPEDRFRVRLHRFNALRHTGGAKEKVHSHKWPAYSLILKGAYQEELFSVEAIDEAEGRADIRVDDVVVREAGHIDFKRVRLPHRVCNVSMAEPCFTLFIRGPSIEPHGLMFDLEEGRVRPWLNAGASLRTGLRDLGELRSDFY